MKQRTPVILNILIILVLLFIVFYMFVQSSDFLASPYFWGTVVISIILALIHNALGDIMENNQFKELTDEQKAAYLAEKRTPFLQRIYRSGFKKQSTKDEKDLLIDHGFDGIMELDNQLPKWWLGLFYFGLAYCAIYLISYAFTNFAHPIDEYDRDYAKQTAEIQAYMATVPQATLETATFSEDNVAEGEQIFKTNCVSCHGEGGRGGIGPNLTDNSWINQKEKTLFKNVFWIVENGSPNNPTMQAWGKNGIITGNDIQKVAAYVYHINQEQAPITPEQGGAAPQGTPANWEK